jgi:hypothetical protein
MMMEFLKAALVASVMLSATMAQAGGPVLIEEGNDELIEEGPVRSAGILPVLGILLLVGLAASAGGGGDGDPVQSSEPIDPVKVFPQP